MPPTPSEGARSTPSGRTTPGDTALAVLAALVVDGRAGPRQIAAATGHPVHRVVESMERLRDAGIVRGYEPRIDYGALGYVTGIVRLRVADDARDDVLERLTADAPVTSAYEVTGASDVIAVAAFPDRAALDAWTGDLAAAPGVQSLSTTPVGRTVREGQPFAPDGE
ncbi:MAG: Lrp/AsnC family transcriptional regulator [Haloarculaceae archaeon]